MQIAVAVRGSAEIVVQVRAIEFVFENFDKRDMHRITMLVPAIVAVFHGELYYQVQHPRKKMTVHINLCYNKFTRQKITRRNI